MLRTLLLICLSAVAAAACRGRVGDAPGAGDPAATGDTASGDTAGAGDTRTAGDLRATGDLDAGGDPLRGDPGTLDCGSIATFADGLTPANEIHVVEGGNDGTADGSLANPYGTVTAALQDASFGPGSAVRIHAGNYSGGWSFSNVFGSANAPIWIGGAPGEARPVFSGGSNGFQASRVRYLVIHDLEITGASANGINCDDGGDYGDPDATRYVVFRNLYIHDIGGTGNQDCLKLSGLDDYFVLGSRFERCGGNQSGSGVDHVGCHAGTLAKNHFEQMSANAVQSKGGSSDIEILWNTMIDAGARSVNIGGSTGYEFFRPPVPAMSTPYEATDIRVLGNVMIGSQAPLAFVGCINCLAAHNTIVDPEHWSIRILQEVTVLTDPDTGTDYTFAACGNNTVESNIFYFARGTVGTDVNIGANTAPDTFTFRNNLWYAHDDPGASQPGLPVAEQDGVVGQDPGFASVGAQNFHIDGGPAAGTGWSPPAPRGDMDGDCWASPPAIGAFETP